MGGPLMDLYSCLIGGLIALAGYAVGYMVGRSR